MNHAHETHLTGERQLFLNRFGAIRAALLALDEALREDAPLAVIHTYMAGALGLTDLDAVRLPGEETLLLHITAASDAA